MAISLRGSALWLALLAFGDADADAGCHAGAIPHFAIGAAYDYATPWHNCAGWPHDPASTGSDFYPAHVRVWVR